MILKKLANIFLRPQSRLLARPCEYSSNTLDLEKLEADSTAAVDVVDDEARIREQKIQANRNKSRLNSADYNRLHGKPPYNQPKHWAHGTLKYQQKMFGTYGDASGFNPAYCWPTDEMLKDRIEYERIAHPWTIQEMVEKAKAKQAEKESMFEKRQQEVVDKMTKLESWKEDLRRRIEKKENEAKQARSKKDRLVEEVRRHFGYTVDPKSDKFKEMLEQKEKEQKKLMKAEKKKLKEQKMLQKLAEIHQGGAITLTTDDSKTNTS